MLAGDEDGEPDPATVRPFLSSEISDYPGVDIEQGPEGSIYYTTLDDGKISRIVYDPEAVTARLKTTGGNPWGDAPLTVHFDAGESTAPAGDTLKYEWDLDGDGEFDDGTNSPTRRSSSEKNRPERKRAGRRFGSKTSTSGKSSVARLTVYPGDSPPKITFVKPESERASPGASASRSNSKAMRDSEEQGNKGADMPAEELNWKMRLLHCPLEASGCHEHPIQDIHRRRPKERSRRPTTPIPPTSTSSSAPPTRAGCRRKPRSKSRPARCRCRSAPNRRAIEIGIGETKLTHAGRIHGDRRLPHHRRGARGSHDRRHQIRLPGLVGRRRPRARTALDRSPGPTPRSTLKRAARRRTAVAPVAVEARLRRHGRRFRRREWRARPRTCAPRAGEAEAEGPPGEADPLDHGQVRLRRAGRDQLPLQARPRQVRRLSLAAGSTAG